MARPGQRRLATLTFVLIFATVCWTQPDENIVKPVKAPPTPQGYVAGSKDDFPDASHQVKLHDAEERVLLEQQQQQAQNTLQAQQHVQGQDGTVQRGGTSTEGERATGQHDGQQQQEKHKLLPPVRLAGGAAAGVVAGGGGGAEASAKLTAASGQQQGREQAGGRLPVWTVALLTIGMAAASGLGSTPFFFVPSLSAYWTGMANAVACGFMLAASFDLLHEGEPYGGGLVTLGVLLGALFISASHKFLEQYEDVEFEQLKGAGARKTLLVVGVMAAHAFGEGCGVGVSFCGDRGWAQGLLVTLAIGVHNIPEGLAKATVLVAQGVPARRALWWSVATCLPQPLVAVPSFMFVDTFKALLPAALGFACGCMVWMVVSELMPDALADAPPRHVASATTLSAACLEAIRMALDTLERPDGTLASPLRAPASVLLPLAATMAVAVVPAVVAGVGLSYARGRVPPSAMLGGAAGALLVSGASGLLNQLLLRRHLSPPLVVLLAGGGAAACRSLWASQSGQASTAMGMRREAWLASGGGADPAGGALPKWHAAVGGSNGSNGCGVHGGGDGDSRQGLNGSVRLPQQQQHANGNESGVVQRHNHALEVGTAVPPQLPNGVHPLAAAAPHRPASPPGKLLERATAGMVQGPYVLAAAFALAAVALHALPEGAAAARSLLESGADASLLLVPCCLGALLRGSVAAAASAPLLCPCPGSPQANAGALLPPQPQKHVVRGGPARAPGAARRGLRWWWVQPIGAALAGGLGPAAAWWCVARSTAWDDSGALLLGGGGQGGGGAGSKGGGEGNAGALEYRRACIADTLSAAGCGVMLATSAWVLGPVSRAGRQPAARAGWLVGAAGALCVCCAQGLLCITSPYCIS